MDLTAYFIQNQMSVFVDAFFYKIIFFMHHAVDCDLKDYSEYYGNDAEVNEGFGEGEGFGVRNLIVFIHF